MKMLLLKNFILLRLQTGYMKYYCFLCYWDSRARDKHYTIKVWYERDSFEPGQRNAAEDPVLDTKNLILPPLHIKLGIVRNFVKAIVRNGNALCYLKSKFPKLSEAKIKGAVFIRP